MVVFTAKWEESDNGNCVSLNDHKLSSPQLYLELLLARLRIAAASEVAAKTKWPRTWGCRHRLRLETWNCFSSNLQTHSQKVENWKSSEHLPDRKCGTNSWTQGRGRDGFFNLLGPIRNNFSQMSNWTVVSTAFDQQCGPSSQRKHTSIDDCHHLMR